MLVVLSRVYCGLVISTNVRHICPRITTIRHIVLPPPTASYATKTVSKKSPATKKIDTTKPTSTTVEKAKPPKKGKAVPEPEKKKFTTKKPKLTDDERMQNKIKEYKKLSLPGSPSKRPLSLSSVFIAEKSKGTTKTNPESGFASIHEMFKRLSDAEKAQLEPARNRINKEREDNYTQWIENHTVQQISEANKARKWLKRNEVQRVDTSVIHDHRRVKSPRSAFIFFASEMLKGEGNAVNRMKDAGVTWKALSNVDKKPYEEMALVDKKRHESEKSAQS